MADYTDAAAFSNMKAATEGSASGIFEKDDYTTRADWLEGLLAPKRQLESITQEFVRENPGVGTNPQDVDRWAKRTKGVGIEDLIMGNMNWEGSNKYGVSTDELNKLFDLEKVQYGQSHYKEGVDTSMQAKEYDALRQDLLTRDY